MAEKWIQKAKIRKGRYHRALGIPMDKKIPVEQMEEDIHKGGSMGKMANLAMTFRKFKRRGK